MSAVCMCYVSSLCRFRHFCFPRSVIGVFSSAVDRRWNAAVRPHMGGCFTRSSRTFHPLNVSGGLFKFISSARCRMDPLDGRIAVFESWKSLHVLHYFLASRQIRRVLWAGTRATTFFPVHQSAIPGNKWRSALGQAVKLVCLLRSLCRESRQQMNFGRSVRKGPAEFRQTKILAEFRNSGISSL